MSRGITGTAAYTSDKATEPEPASGSDRCSEGERAQKELPAAPQQGKPIPGGAAAAAAKARSGRKLPLPRRTPEAREGVGPHVLHTRQEPGRQMEVETRRQAEDPLRKGQQKDGLGGPLVSNTVDRDHVGHLKTESRWERPEEEERTSSSMKLTWRLSSSDHPPKTCRPAEDQ
ncbi:hypothetical protein GWK47_008067 [Chionoecetes opilio]|uniref:Uncharacterized protein n=1 Tax=Chionoecetes opilio TaxID=41210 RepID=A0A8J5CQL7_CHIOP|nr:hypothetical protein GWK47_008067 [Chionoecetes opilio]